MSVCCLTSILLHSHTQSDGGERASNLRTKLIIVYVTIYFSVMQVRLMVRKRVAELPSDTMVVRAF